MLDDVRWCSMAKPAGRNQLHLSSGENQLRESGDLTSKLGVCWVYPANWTWLAGSYQPFKVRWFFHLFWIIWLGFSICYIARGRSPTLQAPNVKTPANPNPNRGFSPVSACQCDRLEPRNAAATPVATPGTTTLLCPFHFELRLLAWERRRQQLPVPFLGPCVGAQRHPCYHSPDSWLRRTNFSGTRERESRGTARKMWQI